MFNSQRALLMRADVGCTDVLVHRVPSTGAHGGTLHTTNVVCRVARTRHREHRSQPKSKATARVG
eukprot:2707512-Alexandrium_andersonii.AAC.1